ncbi:unnamed protein product, partial [Callosobruchus maculatus]
GFYWLENFSGAGRFRERMRYA